MTVLAADFCAGPLAIPLLGLIESEGQGQRMRCAGSVLVAADHLAAMVVWALLVAGVVVVPLEVPLELPLEVLSPCLGEGVLGTSGEAG